MKSKEQGLIQRFSADEEEGELLMEVIKAIKGIKYGCVQIVIHNSKVVQIEKTEKMRMPMPRDGP
jgi:hypothetical protein